MGGPMNIRFVEPWRGRVPGQVDNQLDHGVADQLVIRGIAVKVEVDPPKVSTVPRGPLQGRTDRKLRQ